MIKPDDLGEFLVENSKKINIDALVRKANKDLKTSIITSQLEIQGLKVKLTTSDTRFNGKRFWFFCPNCGRRSANLYKHPIKEVVGCRCCLRLKYRKQRFKEMVESDCIIHSNKK